MNNNIGCVGSKIKLTDDRYMDLNSPKIDDIDLNTIASTLSKLCRFGGRCSRFYSVAEHCIHATKLAESMGEDQEVLKVLLLHDATEAYVGDMVRPLKVMLPKYTEIECKIKEVIGKRFNIDFNLHEATVKHYDHALLKAEKINFWPDDKDVWNGFEQINNYTIDFKFWNPVDAKIQFTDYANKLGVNYG